MDSNQVRGMMEAYASIYEKKGDCVDKKDKGAHNCAKKVCHEQYGEGETIFGQHTVPDDNGFVSHYNVQFEHGIVENVSVEDMEVLTMEGHYKEGHHYEGEQLDEMGGVMKAVGGIARKIIGPADQSPEAEAARMGKRRPQTKQEKGVAAGTVNNEDVDLFDIIKGHLIDEGYADTEESALAIMTNMSEDWKQSIVETIAGGGYTPNPVGNAVRTGAGLLQRAMRNPSVQGTIKTLQKRVPPGGYSTREGDGKPRETPLWGPGSGDAPKQPQRKPQPQAPMRDEPLW